MPNVWHGRARGWGIQAVADALVTNKTITDLNLSHNMLGPEGGITIMHALEKNSTVLLTRA